jgi:predicted adenylyl cyclase CyaB
MPRNVEIKARIGDLQSLALRVAAMADHGPTEIVQDDTFFVCQNGRLKLRTFSEDDGELIFYRRADEKGPRESYYVLSRTSSPDSLREALSHAYGQSGRVQKHRTLFLVGRTRVHLDDVKDLGHFLELEVVLEDHEPSASGVAEAHTLLTRLGVERSQLVTGAYVDLLASGGSGLRPPGTCW